MEIWDINHERAFRIQDGGVGLPGSVFLSGPQGFCVEFDKNVLLDSLKSLFGLEECFDVEVQRLLESA